MMYRRPLIVSWKRTLVCKDLWILVMLRLRASEARREAAPEVYERASLLGARRKIVSRQQAVHSASTSSPQDIHTGPK